MKKRFLLPCLVICLTCSGCALFERTMGRREGVPDKQAVWDGEGYKRTVGIGTGVDPQAQEIERRLGYRPESF